MAGMESGTLWGNRKRPPKHQTDPSSSNAQVWCFPAVRLRTFSRLGTVIGALAAGIASCPSCRWRFDPQHATLRSAVTAQTCRSPVATRRLGLGATLKLSMRLGAGSPTHPTSRHSETLRDDTKGRESSTGFGSKSNVHEPNPPPIEQQKTDHGKVVATGSARHVPGVKTEGKPRGRPSRACTNRRRRPRGRPTSHHPPRRCR